MILSDDGRAMLSDEGKARVAARERREDAMLDLLAELKASRAKLEGLEARRILGDDVSDAWRRESTRVKTLLPRLLSLSAEHEAERAIGGMRRA